MDELGFGKQVNKFLKKNLKMDYVLRQNLVFRLFLENFFVNSMRVKLFS